MCTEEYLRACIDVFPAVSYARTRVEQDLDALTEALAECRKDHPTEFNEGDMALIADGDRDYWTFGSFWPATIKHTITGCFDDCGRIRVDMPRERVVEIVSEACQHIEVTSIILRFLAPRHFAIMSLRVAELVGLGVKATPIEQYLHYLDVLEGIGDDFKELFGEGVAKVDRALWCLAELWKNRHECRSEDASKFRHRLQNYPEAREQARHIIDSYENDAYFRKGRLKRALSEAYRSLPDKKTGAARMLLAECLWEPDIDRDLAAVVTGTAYESFVWGLVRGLGLEEPARALVWERARRRELRLGKLIEVLRKKGITRAFGRHEYRLSGKGSYQGQRNRSIHAWLREDFLKEPKEVEGFIENVGDLVRMIPQPSGKQPAAAK